MKIEVDPPVTGGLAVIGGSHIEVQLLSGAGQDAERRRAETRDREVGRTAGRNVSLDHFAGLGIELEVRAAVAVAVVDNPTINVHESRSLTVIVIAVCITSTAFASEGLVLDAVHATCASVG